MTKLRLLWVLAAGMVAGITSCTGNDDNSIYFDEDSMVAVLPEDQPTADAMTVKIDGATYVIDGDYTDVGKALVDRADNRASDMFDDNLKSIIVPGDKIARLTNQQLAAILRLLTNDGSLVVTEPNLDNLKDMAEGLRFIITQYSKGGNDVITRNVVRSLSTEVLDRIVMWTDNFDYSIYKDAEDNDEHIALTAFRGNSTFVSFDDKLDGQFTASVFTLDENGNDVEDQVINYEDQMVMTEYHYGLKADRAAEWMNQVPDEQSEAASRRAAANAMATRAGDSAEQYLQVLAKSIDKTFDVGLQLSVPSGSPRRHDCVLRYRIWTAYSAEKDCDVYCVEEQVTAYNQQLKCGPDDKHEYYDGKGWAPWEALDKEVSGLRNNVYGPYMKMLYMKCQLKDGNNAVTLENYEPQNNTGAGQNVQNGFSFGMGANASFSSKGPAVSVSASMSWSTSISRFDADLSMKASPSSDGVVEWTYTGADVDAHFGFKFWKSCPHYHDAARPIQVTTCTVQQAWVWTVKSQSKTVTIYPYFKLEDDWMTFDRALNHPGEAVPYYIRIGDLKAITPIIIQCPPRHRQTWSMSVECDAIDAAKLKDIEDYLCAQLKQYFIASCVFYTEKADHKRAYNEDKDVEEFDEIGQFVYKSKYAFAHNSNVIEILRQAGKRGGVADDGSYTIVWRQTDADADSDREEFTFSMQ